MENKIIKKEVVIEYSCYFYKKFQKSCIFELKNIVEDKCRNCTFFSTRIIEEKEII